MRVEVEAPPKAPRGKRPLLLEAYTRGRYAAQVQHDISNPYARNEQMAAAWLKGWESVVCGCD